MSGVVFDSSALLASIYEENGKDIVDEYLDDMVISTVNITEIVEQVIRKGINADDIIEILKSFNMKMVDYSQNHAYMAARLRESTRSLGLSLGDRACLALAISENLPVLTADKAWAKLDVGVEIKIIR